MIDAVWLTAVPPIFVGATLRQPPLVTAVPALAGVCVTFVAGLFVAPLSTLAIGILPFLFCKFPGQYESPAVCRR